MNGISLYSLEKFKDKRLKISDMRFATRLLLFKNFIHKLLN